VLKHRQSWDTWRENFPENGIIRKLLAPPLPVGQVTENETLRELQSPLPDFPLIREQSEFAEVIYRCFLSQDPCRHRH
jgi:hypothetical protein